MTPRNILVITISALLLAIAIAPAGASEITIKVTPQADGVNVPIHAPITLTGAQAKADPQNFTVTVKCAEGKTTPGQIVNGDNGEIWGGLSLSISH